MVLELDLRVVELGINPLLTSQKRYEVHKVFSVPLRGIFIGHFRHRMEEIAEIDLTEVNKIFKNVAYCWISNSPRRLVFASEDYENIPEGALFLSKSNELNVLLGRYSKWNCNKRYFLDQ
jgi:hypothetical protein